MKKIFVDMDGVLTDFNGMYTKLFDRTPAQVKADRVKKEYSEHWHSFVDQRAFAALDILPGGQKLLEFLRYTDPRFVQICILTSAGGFDRHPDVTEQKTEWVRNHLINWPVVVVPGRRYKAGFATSDAIIIDDTYDVVTSFISAGGTGIHHSDQRIDHTLLSLQEWINDTA